MGSEVLSGFHSDGDNGVVAKQPSRRGGFAQAAAGVLVSAVIDGLVGAAREVADQRSQFRAIGLDVLDAEAARSRRRDTSASPPKGVRGIAHKAVESVRVRVARESVVVSLLYPGDVARAAGDNIKEGLAGRARGALQQGEERTRTSATSKLARRLGAR